MVLPQFHRLLVLCGALFFLISAAPGEVASAETDCGSSFLAVFTPTTEGNTYWPEVHRAMAAAADDLGIGIRFFEFPVDDRFAKSLEGVRLLQEDPTPAAAIFSVAFGQAQPLAVAAHQRGIPFLIQGPLFPGDREALGGGPGQDISSWIGTFQEDEEAKGFFLGQALIEAAEARGRYDRDGFIQVVGVGGDTSWFGSRLREEGLRRAVEDHPRARLLQTVPTRWTPEEGRLMTVRLLQRYPQVSVIWAASDQLALGVLQGIRSMEGVPGETHFTGGLDLSRVGLQAVLSGEFTATVASSSYSYAEMVVYLYDYLQGIEFFRDTGREFSPRPYGATRDNAEQILALQDVYRDVDYRLFSKHYNPEMTRYDFALSRIPDLVGEDAEATKEKHQ
ncbi:monosaccharide ABC transporter substrate-binding protein, CUT2 family [Alkalispirochaeta americana]|uniref:Monosaccharide ABC transporter substrate-binding protein, CUT2 family n=1 Tax=Alkalispirochaeta americana TaxID=159291 RepID=A0A1N6N5X6_9SPIO|nr:ABC transporter substrate-binding protein [Alkalispirochaeta americana]SIP87488.1 monosaccharide ABC transporter substrate-binding protein, CUT2 family [Alkalispirochaeta americana]